VGVAREEGFEELFLREIVVEAATKRVKKATHVPAFVSVIRKEDILNYGFLNLYGALAFQPGIEGVESFFGYSEVLFRGVYPTHYNKALFLIDQYPIYEPINGSFHLEFLPLGSINRVEINKRTQFFYTWNKFVQWSDKRDSAKRKRH